MKNYVFLTDEGYTFQPNSDFNIVELDIENVQVIGFASGLNQENAFKNLLKKNKYLLKTSFDKIFCYQLDDNYKDSQKYFYLSENKNNGDE